ncbi:MAG TPA: hypothetical protein PK891_02280 [Bacteroidales bacterium]|nr:hypothetical protein [Bacteroidales bacterium]HOY90526.1 hypothetical protein [Bacteroidales bacterium]
MERKSYTILIILFFISFNLFSQNNKKIYEAYIRGKMNDWQELIDSLNNSKYLTNRAKLDLINYEYGYIAWCIDNEKNDEAKSYLKRAQKRLEYLENISYNTSMINAYKAAFIGFEIGINPYKAPLIGMKSQSYANKAIEIDPNNYFAYLQLANIYYYAPAIAGGSKVKAMDYYLKALNIIERNPEMLKNNWNYLNLLVTIINCYIDNKQYDKALQYAKKVLKIEPNFLWVKNQIYPELIKKTI